MKSTIFKTVILSFTLIGLAACSSSKEDSKKTGIAYTSTYVCPMHCEGSGSDKAGQCPVCGMDYVLNKENSK
ncbi:MAG: hypothetical protein KC517_10565 [Bacteroidetes bacterium]|jgi:hypothetical protein|nr:hypothetical protein [Bacteroidota bacterium]